MRSLRITLVAGGAVVVGYGCWLMVGRQTPAQVRGVLEWAVAGVLLHDAVLAPVAVAAGWVVQRRLPHRVARPVAVALVLIGTITVSGFAVLTRSHGGGRNGTLLDRDYPLGLAILVAAVVAGVALVSLVGSRFSGRRRSR